MTVNGSGYKAGCVKTRFEEYQKPANPLTARKDGQQHTYPRRGITRTCDRRMRNPGALTPKSDDSRERPAPAFWWVVQWGWQSSDVRFGVSSVLLHDPPERGRWRPPVILTLNSREAPAFNRLLVDGSCFNGSFVARRTALGSRHGMTLHRTILLSADQISAGHFPVTMPSAGSDRADALNRFLVEAGSFSKRLLSRVCAH